jgi:hypothetical protein
LYEIDLSSEQIYMTSQVPLAIVMRSAVSDSDSFLWAGDAAGGYANGGAFTRTVRWQAVEGFDAGFRSFVPEPSGAAGAAFLTLVLLRRRQRARKA